MKLTIFGATGPTGLLLTRRAADAGHDVTVYVRNPAKLTIQHENLKVVQGEISDPFAIAATLEGQEAVISVLGSTQKSEGSPLTNGMRNIVSGMTSNGVRRLVAISTPSYVDRADQF